MARLTRIISHTARHAAIAAAGLLCAMPTVGQVIQDELPDPVRDKEFLVDVRGAQVPLQLDYANDRDEQILTGDLFDGTRPVVLAFFYLDCPLLCPQLEGALIDTLNKVDLELGDDYRVALVSMSPRDTSLDAAKRKREHMLEFTGKQSTGGEDAWTLLTMLDQRTTPALAEALGFNYDFQPGTRQYAHNTSVYVLTPSGTVSRQFGLVPIESKDMQLALVEASEGKVGSFFDKLTLFCFHFDPSANTYTLAAFRVMRIGSALTVVALGVLVAALFVRERARRRRRHEEQKSSVTTVGSRTSAQGPQLIGHST